MPTIEYTTSAANAQRLVTATKGIFPIPQVMNGKTGEMENQFTDEEWVKEVGRRHFINTVKSWEVRTAGENIQADDELI